MEKRLALALVLCFLLILVHNWIFQPDAPYRRGETDPGVSTERPTDGETGGERGTGKPLDSGQGDTATGETETVPSGEGTYEGTEGLTATDLVVDTEIYRATFSNQGASLKSIRFKDFYTDTEVLKNPERMADPANWLEVLGEIKRGIPSFMLRESGTEANPARYALDTVCWKHQVLEENPDGPTVLFSYRTRDGLIFRKTFQFFHGAYHLDLTLEVENRNPDLNRSLSFVFDGPCGIEDGKRASFTAGPMGVLYTVSGDGRSREPELETLQAGDLKNGYQWKRREFSEFRFGGVANNYFALLLKPVQGKMVDTVRFYALEDSRKLDQKVAEIEARNNIALSQDRIEQIRREHRADALTNVKNDYLLKLKTPPPGTPVSQRFLFFAGPKKISLMKTPPYGEFYALIEDSYGWMPWINTSLLYILEFFHSIVRNWGVAIILLTLLVKACLFPLSRVQQVSMQGYSEKMKKLKPKLDEIKKRFKNNKKKFNEAQMKLMREEGIRPPLMGCLILFLQLPIFIGIFQILRNAFELRHSPFCLWVQDLSQPDALPLPFTLPLLGNSINLLPIAMTVAFYYQQKMMPKPDTSDPSAQSVQKMMRFMPIIFGVMFYGYASGLSLYWMTSNILTILEYRFIRKRFPVGKEAAGTGVPAPAKAAPKSGKR